MADEAKGFPWVLLIIAAAVLYFLSKATGAASKVGKSTGEGIGKGAVDEVINKASSPGALSALGTFVGGLFGGSDKKTSAAWSDDSPPESTVGYDPGEDFDEWSSGFFGPGIGS